MVRPRSVLGNQRGITGLETAIVLIAFVVVSSVFAFAALSTGLYSSDKAKETILAGLTETRGSMQIKGSVIAEASASGTTGNITTIAFHVANSVGGEAVNLTPGKTLIKYSDETQSKMFVTDNGFTVTGLGDADSDKLLERNEVYELKLINLASNVGPGNDTLTNKLGINTTFSLEVIPPRGAVLFIERTTPISMDSSMSLD